MSILHKKDSIFLEQPTPQDAKLCNYYVAGSDIIIESIAGYLGRLDETVRIPEIPVTMLLPKIGYDSEGIYPIEDFAGVLTNFEGKQYAFVDGLADENFVQITANSDMGWVKLVSVTTQPAGTYALGSLYFNAVAKKILVLKNSGWVMPVTPSLTAIYYFNKGFYVWDGTNLVKIGSLYSSIKIEYSVNGIDNWHTGSGSDDLYYHFSVDGGEIWGDAIEYGGTSQGSSGGDILTASNYNINAEGGILLCSKYQLP